MLRSALCLCHCRPAFVDMALPLLCFAHLLRCPTQVPMTYIDKIERDSDRKGGPRADRYYNADVVATIHCKVSGGVVWCSSKR